LAKLKNEIPGTLVYVTYGNQNFNNRFISVGFVPNDDVVNGKLITLNHSLNVSRFGIPPEMETTKVKIDIEKYEFLDYWTEKPRLKKPRYDFGDFC
jgi:hypothetical protein